MIFARDKSQMCNNLLQYAHVYAWGREHGRKVISMRFSYKYQYFHICHTSLTGFGWYLLAKYLAAVKILPTASFKRADCDREALERMMLRHRHIVVSGWNVRFYDLFLKYRQEICDLFRIDDCYTTSVKKKMRDICDSPSAILRLGVHIRRGDYATWNDGRFFYSLEEYHQFMLRVQQLYNDRRVSFFISSNEDFSLDLFEGCCCQRFGKEPSGAILDLYTLSVCDRIIGPFSSYSRWASFIGEVPLCFLESKGQQFTEESFSKIIDYFHFENGKEILDW